MDIKVVAIAAIFCLDLAFIFLTRLSLQYEEFATAVVPPPTQAIAAPARPVAAHEAPPDRPASVQPDTAVEPDNFKRVAAKRNGQFISQVRVPRRAPRRATIVTATAAPFRDTVIYVRHADGRREVSGSPADAATRPTKPIEMKRKKPSVFKRALPVIKKPYTWLKSLVSKI